MEIKWETKWKTKWETKVGDQRENNVGENAGHKVATMSETVWRKMGDKVVGKIPKTLRMHRESGDVAIRPCRF